MSNRFILVALTVALVAPATAMAAWSGKGNLEPDTSFDDDGYMFLNPDKSSGSTRNVYFSGFAGAATVILITSVNPNSGHPLLQSSIIQPSNFNAQALLGVWKDCNGDGYIGFGDNALWEYRSVLLTLPGQPGTTICPPVPIVDADPSTPAFDVPHHTGYTMHNDGEWVREFIPIGPETTNSALPSDQNPFNMMDNGARVWADWGVPGSPPGYICYFLSHPTGSFSTVGSMIHLADCFARGRIDATLGSVAGRTGPTGQAYTELKATQNPWGRPTDSPAVVVGDCTAPLVPSTRVPGTQLRVLVPRPTPAAGSGASVAGTLSHADAAFTDCDREKSATGADTLAYVTEEEINNQYGRKTINEWVLKFTEDVRPGPAGPLGSVAGRGTSKDLGTRPTMEGFWRAGAISLIGRNPLINIDTLGPQPVQYITYYATVSGEAISRYTLNLPGPVGTYGAEACGTNIGTGQPDRNFWSCDPDVWWPTKLQQDPIVQGLIDGKSAFWGVKIGQTYQLRDVDCYDTSAKPLREQGVFYPPLVGSPCA